MNNINSVSNNNFIAIINDDCSVSVKAIKDSMNKSTIHTMIDNHNNVNKLKSIVE